MRVRTTYGQTRGYTFTKVSDKTAMDKIPGTEQTVAQYYRDKYNIRIVLPHIPLVVCGDPKNGTLIPMELLVVYESWQRLKRKLPDKLQALTTRYTTTEPKRRFNHIINMQEQCQVYEDPIASAFGLEVGKKMLEIEGRILDSLNVNQRLKKSQGFNPLVVDELAVINVDKTVREKVDCITKTQTLVDFCADKGLRFTKVNHFDLDTRRNWRNDLENLQKNLKPNSLALFVLRDTDKTTYDDVKTVADLTWGLRTQFIRTKTFLKIAPRGSLIENLCRKLNNKVGNSNAYIDTDKWSKFTNPHEATLFVGIDVTHTTQGENYENSVAALVTNLDLNATKYGTAVRILPPRCEQVTEVGEMLVHQMKQFYTINHRLPKHIVIFRDGVSDSQFDMVRNIELQSMKKHCKATWPKAEFTFTIVIVQKRHSTRFYAPKDGDQKGNVLQGTVVDRFITHETDKTFYLCAHKGLLGTSRPICCVVIEDEWNLSADELQNCTNILCNLVGRASGPVSLPAPVQYAHLVCYRARSYINSYRNNNRELPDHQNGTGDFNPHDNLRSFIDGPREANSRVVATENQLVDTLRRLGSLGYVAVWGDEQETRFGVNTISVESKVMRLIAVFALVFVVVWAAETPSNDLGITATRTVDVTSQIVKTTVEYEIKNNGKSPVNSFLHGISSKDHEKLAWIGANWEKRDGKKLTVSKVDVASGPKDTIYYKIDLITPIDAGETGKLVLRLELTQTLRAYPKQITQLENQFMVYDGNAYLNSPYTVDKQTTSVKVGSVKVIDFTPIDPAKHQSDSIKYGPYSKIAPGTNKPITVHYENNSPFVVITSLNRWIEVSHWGNIAVEDTIEIVHRGATLKGQFSRLDFQMDRRGNNQPVVKQLKTQIPVSARDIYYRDQIGNISTSIVTKRANRVEVELRPRFPLFGGWKTNYVLGYNVPSIGFLHSSGSDYALKIPFIDRIYDNAVIEKATVKIVLPEASRNFKVASPFPIKQKADEVHKTYLDTVGRTVIVIEKENLVNSHAQPITVYYQFDRIMLLREPLLAVAAFFLLFLIVIVFVRLDFSIVDKPEQHLKKE
ncbi:Dolichyl-diphosphooligosaccharide--protein glycosyltransferase subunit 1 [Aphelenchoides besseyi]|nr:Dolichyl-diphosphooligosaccharide--protein glycosyltransferase subunit 1 [Aphelenchoides besseyi]